MKLCGISVSFLFTVPFAIIDLDSQSHASWYHLMVVLLSSVYLYRFTWLVYGLANAMACYVSNLAWVANSWTVKKNSNCITEAKRFCEK